MKFNNSWVVGQGKTMLPMGVEDGDFFKQEGTFEFIKLRNVLKILEPHERYPTISSKVSAPRSWTKGSSVTQQL